MHKVIVLIYKNALSEIPWVYQGLQPRVQAGFKNNDFLLKHLKMSSKELLDKDKQWLMSLRVAS